MAKLTPDEMAEAVKKLVTDNGDLLIELTFHTLKGEHSYRTDATWRMDGTPVAIFTP